MSVGWKPRDADVPHVDVAQAAAYHDGPAPGRAAAELVGLHGDVDAAHATLSPTWQALVGQRAIQLSASS
jgi:hypothetical protein